MVNFLKFGALSAILLLLSSCTQYKYDVTWKSCNGIESGSLSYIDNAESYPRIQEWKSYSSPTLRDNFGDSLEKRNVCSFDYTKTEVIDTKDPNKESNLNQPNQQNPVSMMWFVLIVIWFSLLFFVAAGKSLEIIVKRMTIVLALATILFLYFVIFRIY